MDNRAALLDTALNLFAAKGYDSVGVQEIVDRVGVTKPTLYHYFGSKEGLLQSLLSQYFTLLNQQLELAIDYQGDLTRNLTAAVQQYFDFARQNPVYYRLQLALWFAPRESDAHRLVAGFYEKQYQMFETLFSAAARDHGNMRGRSQAYAASFIGMINTYIGLWLNDRAVLDDPRAYQVVHQFEHGIYS
jgi:AcrR family transcriptional regulator